MTVSLSKRRLLAAAGAAVLVVSRARAADPTDIFIDNFTFSPNPLHVPVGTTVKWTNRDDIPHSILCVALGFRSHPLDTDDSFTYTFDKAGTYDYICGIHPFMKGQVIVS